ncbi:MAG: alpha-L-fucosidase [Oscillospiraceae bacterium]
MDTNIEKAIQIVPSERQLSWQRLEFTAFLHYGLNSFTNSEWGTGAVDTSIFNPQKLNTDNWCESLMAAGIKACLFTAKHHDGFCLWDTKQTEYSVMNSPYGKDILAQLKLSCKKYGMKLGIYLSPWDRHESRYGTGKAYDDYYCAQITELLTNYGDIYCVWFDGACGEGENGKKQRYDWDRYFKLIRKLQPNAVMSICGPDVRWCGNEAGDCRESEWSVVPIELRNAELVANNSQKEDNDIFVKTPLKSSERDLGSRKKIEEEDELIWYPSEVDVSIRPGWFYHENQDNKLRSLEELFELYKKTVGGNSVLLLNVPPHYDGYIAECDSVRLAELGKLIRETFSNNLSVGAKLSASSTAEEKAINFVTHNDDTYWKAADGQESCEIAIQFDSIQKIKCVVLMEHIKLSQRIEAFEIYAKNDKEQTCVYCGTTVGYKKICTLPDGISAQELIIKIIASRSCPTLEFIGVYR